MTVATLDADLLTAAARLAEAFPERFIWFPAHEALRISLDGEHRIGGACADAHLANPAHHGMVQWAVQQECDARNWALKLDTSPHPTRPHACVVIYTPTFHYGMAPSVTLATIRALLNAHPEVQS